MASIDVKAILDTWMAKYIKQTIDYRAGTKIAADELDSILNLMIQQGDSTTETVANILDYVTQYVTEHQTLHTDLLNTINDLSGGAIDAAAEARTATVAANIAIDEARVATQAALDAAADGGLPADAIVDNDITNDATKVASAAVVYRQGLEIDTKANTSDITSDTATNDANKIASAAAVYAVMQAMLNKINTADIVQSDTVNNATKVPSSAVTYAHGQAITALQNTTAITGISGTWTPTIANGGTGTATGYAEYYRISKFVFIAGFLTIRMSTTNSAQITIGGLPYTAKSIRFIFPVGYSSIPNMASYTLEGVSNTNTVGIQGKATNVSMPGTALTTNTDYIIQFSGVYECV
jgi:hypothetical protein